MKRLLFGFALVTAYAHYRQLCIWAQSADESITENGERVEHIVGLIDILNRTDHYQGERVAIQNDRISLLRRRVDRLERHSNANVFAGPDA